MSAISIKAELDTYFPMLSPEQQESTLAMIKSILNVGTKHPKVSLLQYNQELDEALKRVKEGKSISHEDLKKEADEW